MAQHAKHSASSAHRWMACPGSLNAIAALPSEEQDRSGPAALEGTRAHELAEAALRHGYRWPDGIARLQEAKGAKTEMLEGVSVYVDAVFQGMEIGVRAIDWDGTEDYEARVQFYLAYDDGFGTADAILVDKDALRVYDFKYGFHPVEVEDNPQLLCYLLGAIRKHGTRPHMEVVIVQPRATHADGPIRRWTVTKERLRAFAQELKLAWAETEKPTAPKIPGKHCQWCPAAARCEALQSQVRDSVLSALTPIDGQNPLAFRFPVLAGPEIGELKRRADLAKEYAKAVDDLLFRAVQSGVEGTGYKLVEGRRSRDWADDFNIWPEEITEICVKSPAQSEKIMGKKWVEERTVWSAGRPTLAPETDRRPAIAASSDLANLLTAIEE